MYTMERRWNRSLRDIFSEIMCVSKIVLREEEKDLADFGRTTVVS